MVNIVIAGLPRNVKIPKFIHYLEQTVLHEISNARLLRTVHVDNKIKNITISLRSNDARKVRRYLNGLQYQYAGKVYPLECWQTDAEFNRQAKDRDEMEYRNLPVNENVQSNSVPQNSSMLRREMEDIDLKIEIVKRQRILMEEENKLLLTQKKSELLKKIEPNNFENIVEFEKICGLDDLNEIAKIQPTPATNTNAKKKNGTKLPNFKMPCKIIIKEMKDVLDDYVKPENRDIVMSLINSVLRKRLILVLQGKGFMPAPDIVHLYRVNYPRSTDKDLLEELMDTISQSFWPKTQGVNDENSQINTKNEDTVSDVVENTKKDENTTEDNNDVQVINDNNDVQLIDVNSSNNVENIETKEESENHKSEAETHQDEKTIESLDNVDAVVDMDKDFDEWVDNESKSDGKVEAEAADKEL